MLLTKVKVAVVEYNKMAHDNIHNHLINMGFSRVSCFSNGRELKANLNNLKLYFCLKIFNWVEIKTA